MLKWERRKNMKLVSNKSKIVSQNGFQNLPPLSSIPVKVKQEGIFCFIVSILSSLALLLGNELPTVFKNEAFFVNGPASKHTST